MTASKVTTLDKLKVGKDAIIQSVECDDEALRCRIIDMGLTPNVEVTLVKTAPLGDPLEIRLRGYNLTLRKADASKIKIADIHNAHDNIRKNQEYKTTEHSQLGEEVTYSTRKKSQIPKNNISLALIGNQNSGKTTLFNKLTGSNQHVGNFPGVTVDKTQGIIKNHKDILLTDLPGIYSLSPYSSEEVVTRNFLLNEKPDGIINIVDAANIERNLYLTMQLMELDIPMVIALNMMDEVANNGGSIDINGIEKYLGVPVVPISAIKDEGIEELLEHVINVAKFEERPGRLDFCENNKDKSGAVHRCIHSIIHQIESDIPDNYSVRFIATKLAERDPLVMDISRFDQDKFDAINKLVLRMEEETGLDHKEAMADMRFAFIERVCSQFVFKTEESLEYKFTNKLDRILTGKYTAILVFMLIMAFIFYMTFGHVGNFLSDLMENFVGWITNNTDAFLTSYGLNRVVHSLIINGVFSGIGSVLSFLPIIIILFFFLSILEDTGYMARVAFIMDKLLRKIGLSGRSFVPMLIGFGCSVPAIMATRTLSSERDRKMTILLAPFMSCSAKLPIYALFAAAFFESHQVEVIVGLYLIGIIVGILFACILKVFMFRGEPIPFVMELPNYRMPSLSNIWRLIYMKAKDFVMKAFTIIFWAAIIIWFLENFDAKLNLVTDSSQSILAMLGNFITPVFKPLGINDWRISTAFFTGFMAKESVVSTLTILNGGDIGNISQMFTKLSAFVFLVFCLLYTPCVAAIATVRRELGRRYAFMVVFMQCIIAWVVAFSVYRIGLMF